MGRVEIENAQLQSIGSASVTFTFPGEYETAVANLALKIISKHNRYTQLIFGTPFVPKSTGPESSNNHAWGHARQIAAEIGDDIRAVLREACVRAIPLGFGFKPGKLGPIPTPWDEVSSEEAHLAIEMLHQIAAFIPMTLKEDSKWKLFDSGRRT